MAADMVGQIALSCEAIGSSDEIVTANTSCMRTMATGPETEAMTSSIVSALEPYNRQIDILYLVGCKSLSAWQCCTARGKPDRV